MDDKDACFCPVDADSLEWRRTQQPHKVCCDGTVCKDAAGPRWAPSSPGARGQVGDIAQYLRMRKRLQGMKEEGGWKKGPFTTSHSGLGVMRFWVGWSNEWWSGMWPDCDGSWSHTKKLDSSEGPGELMKVSEQ